MFVIDSKVRCIVMYCGIIDALLLLMTCQKSQFFLRYLLNISKNNKQTRIFLNQSTEMIVNYKNIFNQCR
jgi:hypothetical protein